MADPGDKLTKSSTLLDDNTLKLINELGKKLGTTGEHLWLVLVQQAPISAAISMIWILVLTASAALLVYIVRMKTTVQPGQTLPDLENEDAMIVWVLTVIYCIAILFFIQASSFLVVAGFFNPEYWALKQIWK